MRGVFEVCVKTHFSAAHSLKGYSGDCSRLHGHNWMVEVYVKCKELDKSGIGIDFREIEKGVKEVLQKLDHAYLNDLSLFQDINPTAEHVAQYLYREFTRKFNSDRAKVSRVKVSETPEAGAFYWEE